MQLGGLALLLFSVVESSTVLVFNASTVYPGYEGNVTVTGSVTLTEQDSTNTHFALALSGFQPLAQVSLYVHTGLSCAPDMIGGYFYSPFNGTNPYDSVAYSTADSNGQVTSQFSVNTGYPYDTLLGRALVVYTGEGKTGVTCAVTKTFQPVRATLSRFSPFQGTANVSGEVSVLEPSDDRLSFTYILKGLPTSSPPCSLFIARGDSCHEANVEPLWHNASAANPWDNQVTRFSANAQGQAEGAFELNQASVGFSLAGLRGHAVVVRLGDGSIAACGVLPHAPVPEHELDQGNWALGVLCSTLASFGTVVGMLLQKWSHMQESKKGSSESKTHVMCRPLWWLSLFFMILVPAPLDIAAFAFASQSLLAPLSGVTLLLNAVFAPLVLKEKVTRRDLFASVLIAVGAGITTVFGAHTQTQYTVPTLYILFARPMWIIGQVLANVGVFFLYGCVKLALSERSRFVNLRILAKNYLAYLLALLVALSGAQQMVFTKTVSELIAASVDGDMQFTYLLTYVLIGLAVWMAVFQIGYLNKGLELFDAVYFLPLYNAALIVLCIVVGGVYFDEVAHVSWWQILLFVAGVGICLFGVLLLKKRPPTIDTASNKETLIVNDELAGPAEIYSDAEL